MNINFNHDIQKLNYDDFMNGECDCVVHKLADDYYMVAGSESDVMQPYYSERYLSRLNRDELWKRCCDYDLLILKYGDDCNNLNDRYYDYNGNHITTIKEAESAGINLSFIMENMVDYSNADLIRLLREVTQLQFYQRHASRVLFKDIQYDLQIQHGNEVTRFVMLNPPSHVSTECLESLFYATPLTGTITMSLTLDVHDYMSNTSNWDKEDVMRNLSQDESLNHDMKQSLLGWCEDNLPEHL